MSEDRDDLDAGLFFERRGQRQVNDVPLSLSPGVPEDRDNAEFLSPNGSSEDDIMRLLKCALPIVLVVMGAVTPACFFLARAFASDEKIDVKPLLESWEKQVRKRINKNDKLKALAAKSRLVVLHSRRIFAKGDYLHSAYNFLFETSDPQKHGNYVHLLFHNSRPNTFQFNRLNSDDNLLVHLGTADFAKDPDPRKISIDEPGVLGGDTAEATEGHLYLLRIRDDMANFYVLFQIVAVDKNSHYMAFLWRKLPGGKGAKD